MIAFVCQHCRGMLPRRGRHLLCPGRPRLIKVESVTVEMETPSGFIPIGHGTVTLTLRPKPEPPIDPGGEGR